MRLTLAALAAAGLWPQLHAPHTEGAPSEGAQNGGAWAGPKLNKGAIEQRADTFKHANSVMSSPDVRIVVADGGSSQMMHVREGGSFQYTVSLSHPPSTTRGEDVIDFSQDTVQIWLTSSQAVMQEESPGSFVSHQGHQTQLIISTDRGTSEDLWRHEPWTDAYDAFGHWLSSTSGDSIRAHRGTDQSDGEALLEFDSTNWDIPQTVTVTARQDDVFEPRVHRRGQEAYVHHKAITPEGFAPSCTGGPTCPTRFAAASDATAASCPAGCTYTVGNPNCGYNTCTGTATEVAATCTGTAADGTSTCDFDAVTDGTAECPEGCDTASAFTPTCDLDANTDGTASCPAGCTTAAAFYRGHEREYGGTTCGWYHHFPMNDIVVSIEDDDPAVVLQDINDPIPTEGGKPAFITLKLASEPMSAVNVSLTSGPVRHPDLPEQVRYFSEGTDHEPNVSYTVFTPASCAPDRRCVPGDWDVPRTFRIEAVDDDVDEWTYTGRFRPSEIGYKIESEDYYYRNNGTSCLHERIGSRSSLAEIQRREHQCVCMHEDPLQIEEFKPDQYHTRGMKCGAIATPVDNNYRFVNVSIADCTIIEGGTNCDYTVRLNSAPGFNPYDYNHDLPSRVVVHIREENEIERQALREHDLFFTEWLQVAPPADFDAAEHVNNTEIVRETMCKAMNETVWPLINATCFDEDDLVGMSKRGCSIECEGLVVPYFEQCVFEYGIGGFSRFNETDEMDEEDALAANATGPVVRLGTAAEIMELYEQCGGEIFNGTQVGHVWVDHTDGRGGSKTGGISRWHTHGYQVQAGWEIDLVFDASNWDIERKISVVAFNDDVDEPDEMRTVYHTTSVELRQRLDVVGDDGVVTKTDVVTNDATYFPHNKTIETPTVDIHVIDNDIADVLLGCRSFDSKSQIGSIEGYGGFENRVPRSFRFTPGESETEGELACVIHTQECSPKSKPIELIPYQEKWTPSNLTDPYNCSEWITQEQILSACCVDWEPTEAELLDQAFGSGVTGSVDCSSGVPNTCTSDCAEAFPLFYERCWPEMNWILQGNGTKDGLKFIPDPDGPTAASQLQVDHFQMQCAAVMNEFETPEDIARVTSQDDTEPITSCLPLITRLETEFEEHCCPDSPWSLHGGSTCSIPREGVPAATLPDDCRPTCREFFDPIYDECSQVWKGTGYHLNMGPNAGWYSADDLEQVYETCYGWEGTEVDVDWVYSLEETACAVLTDGQLLAETPALRPKGDSVVLDGCYEGSMAGTVVLPPTNRGSRKWQLEFQSMANQAEAKDATDWMEVTVNGETRTTLNDDNTAVSFTVMAIERKEGDLVYDVLEYSIKMATGCDPGEQYDDCLPDWSVDCPCPQSALSTALHMTLPPGKARAVASPRQIDVNATDNAVVEEVVVEEVYEDLPCTLGTYTLHLNSDPGTKRIRTFKDGYSDDRRSGSVEGPPGGESSNGDMLVNAGRPGKEGGGAPFEKVYGRAVQRMEYDHKLVPVVIEVTPDPTPHTRYETSHGGGTSCKFTRANWDKPCTVTAFPTMDALLRTPWTEYWNTRQIIDHTAHTVTQSFFGQEHGYADEYWNYTVPYQLYTPGPGPHGQDVGEVPTGSDSPIMEGEHLSENALELCTVRKGAYEDERYTKNTAMLAAAAAGPAPAAVDGEELQYGEDGQVLPESMGDVSAKDDGVYDEVVCRWGGRRTHTEGTPNKYGPNVLWNHTLYRHPIQVRYVMINDYNVPGGGQFGQEISSVPQADPLLNFTDPIAGALRDEAFGPRVEDVYDARRCANYCLQQDGCKSFDYAPQAHRCYLNAGVLQEGDDMVMVDDMLPAAMQPKAAHGDLLRDGVDMPGNRGTISTIALSQAYYHHYRLRDKPLAPSNSTAHDKSQEDGPADTCPCERVGSERPDFANGAMDTERTGRKYKAVAVPEDMSHEESVKFCRRECCLDDERQCRTWVVRAPLFSLDGNSTEQSCPENQRGSADLGVRISDTCRGIPMGTCTIGASTCCFLIDDPASVPYTDPPLEPGAEKGPAFNSVSGQVFRDELWPTSRGFNFMPQYAINAVEMWRDYDRFEIERELAVAASESGGRFNTVRVPLSYEVWAHNATEFGDMLQHFVDAAHYRGMRTIPVVFDMTQHPRETRCSLHTVSPDDLNDTRKCWYPQPSYTLSDDLEWWVKEGHEYLDWLAELLPAHNPGMLLWDIVTSPEDYPPPRPDARPDMPRRPAPVLNGATGGGTARSPDVGMWGNSSQTTDLNASEIVGVSVSGPGVSYSVPLAERAWEQHVWTFAQYMATYMRKASSVPVTIVSQPSQCLCHRLN